MVAPGFPLAFPLSDYPTVFMLSKLLFGLIVLFQAAGNTRVVEEKHPNGTVRERREVIVDSAGRAVNHGLAETFYEDGQRAASVQFVNGNPQGRAVEWHRNGQVKRERNFVEGRIEGPDIAYYQDGTKAAETSYRNGAKHGADAMERGR